MGRCVRGGISAGGREEVPAARSMAAERVALLAPICATALSMTALQPTIKPPQGRLLNEGERFAGAAPI
jgi:hypothetical protein